MYRRMASFPSDSGGGYLQILINSVPREVSTEQAEKMWTHLRGIPGLERHMEELLRNSSLRDRMYKIFREGGERPDGIAFKFLQVWVQQFRGVRSRKFYPQLGVGSAAERGYLFK